MKLAEFIEKNDFDGELVLNEINFMYECSFCMNRTKVGKLAFERYGKVLNSEVKSITDKFIVCENCELEDSDEAYNEGIKFLFASSGYISVGDYEACFPDS